MTRDDIKTPKAKLATDADPAGFGPADLQNAYDLPSSTNGAGQTVAIVDAFDNPDAEAELGAYRTQFGLPECTTDNGCFKKVDQRGGTDYPVPDDGWAGEISLDVQMVSAVCPSCHILLVESDDNSMENLGAAVNQAVEMGAKFVSNSWGGSEGSFQLAADAQYFDHPGVAITASSGDSGYGVSYPAASQYVTSVGGTSLVKDASARGWGESVWAGAGSGCSAYDPKPSVQQDTGCSRRTVSDVSAVANPSTGVAVFFDGAWRVFGGTSVSAPIIASVYALGGAPVAGSRPNTYPYSNPGKLNDVTSGSNGSCSGSYLCTAKEGYDGPTGLGTPKGIGAFSAGPHATVRGKVTDAADGKPLVGARVSAGDFATSTDAEGRYEMTVDPGTYAVKVAKFGYGTKTFDEATVADGQSVTDDAALTAKARVAVSGKVTDGSGHDWPLYASVSVKGEPTSAVHTDPATGGYTIQLPEDDSYTLQVDPAYPGYEQATKDVTVAGDALTQNVGVTVDANSCSAAGYKYTYHATAQNFDGADGTTPPQGWTIVDNQGTGQVWKFNDPRNRGNHTGGSGEFAIIDSDSFGQGGKQDASLVSPAWDFSDVAHPIVTFNSDFHGYPTNSFADVDLSTDGGTTWTNVSHWVDSRYGPRQETLDLSAAGGKSQAQIRFHYKGSFAWWWAVDDVFAGERTCDPRPAGLVVGQVTDRNTKTGVPGALVFSDDKPAEGAATVSTPDDPALGDGFYWFVSSLTGSHPVTAKASGYTAKENTVAIAADSAATSNYSLTAGRLKITPTTVDKAVAWKGTKTATVTVKNTGSADTKVKISENGGRFDLQKMGAGAAVQNVKGDYTPEFIAPDSKEAKATPTADPYAPPWTTVANFKTAIMDNAVATGDAGKVYSVAGINGSALVSTAHVYDPAALAWNPMADSKQTREAPQAAYLNGKLYVTGGWNATGATVLKTQAYDPATDTWSDVANIPKGYAGAGSATLDGKWYVVGGCTSSCGTSDVQVYDPGSGAWSAAADYPEPTSWLGCGAIDGKLYCAGGTKGSTASKHAYVYDPSDDAWSPLPDMPLDLWAGGSTAVGGKLLLSGGVTNNNASVTNRGVAYDPEAGAWSDIANSNNTLYRGGSSCGFYKVGGSVGGFNPVSQVEQLPGLGDCDSSSDVDWLSVNTKEMTLAPGQSQDVTVTVNANLDSVAQPGVYKAGLAIGEDTPYAYAPVGVTMTVSPPSTWGKIAGTIAGTACSADPAALKGATLQIDSWAQDFSLKTDKGGKYALWLDVRNNPLQLIAAKDGWAPQARTVKIVKLATTTADFNLKPDHSC